MAYLKLLFFCESSTYSVAVCFPKTNATVIVLPRFIRVSMMFRTTAVDGWMLIKNRWMV